jgi:hypothetical protein
MTTSAMPKTVERRIQGVIVQYVSEGIGPDGEPRKTLETRRRGELATLSAQEAARLDGLAVLCPPDTSVEEMEEQSEIVKDSYRQARRSISDTALGG